MNDLGTLHELGYVHGDIRSENLVFSQENGKAWIIDFDLAGKEGTYYPVNYNHLRINKRHSTAKAGFPRKKEHDRNALSVIFGRHYGESHNDVVLISDMSLSEIAKKLTEQP